MGITLSFTKKDGGKSRLRRMDESKGGIEENAETHLGNHVVIGSISHVSDLTPV